MKVTLITHTPNPEKIIAGAANLCYSAKDIEKLFDDLTEKRITQLVSMLESMGHESPFEHINFTFGIEGVSRSLTHQLVRHRIGSSYSQKSQRYVREGSFEYVIPPAIEKNFYAKDVYIKSMRNAQFDYDEIVNALLQQYCRAEILKRGYKPNFESWAERMKTIDLKLFNQFEKQAIEDARYVLPNACETKIVVTMNARALFNLFSKRCCDRAQWEIRDLANEMLRIVREVAPTVFKNAGPTCIRGKCPEGSMSCGKPKKK